MIDVVFSDGAHGSLRAAQHYGEGDYGGATGVIFSSTDGSRPTDAEIQAAQRKAEARERRKWETAEPMGEDLADIYGFAFGLSAGDITEDIPGEARRQALSWLYSIYPDMDGDPLSPNETVRDEIEEIRGRISSGEGVRLWYSNEPDELCGMHWFMALLDKWDLPNGQVLLVQLPDQKIDREGNFVTRTGWGGLHPGEWRSHLPLQRPASRSFCRGCAAHWRRLQGENAPLRATLNGRLVSVPETLYDDFILREIAAGEAIFHEATVIGRVLGKYELGIGDAWIAHRIEAMIDAGLLLPATAPEPGGPIYHRRLRKCGC